MLYKSENIKPAQLTRARGYKPDKVEVGVGCEVVDSDGVGGPGCEGDVLQGDPVRDGPVSLGDEA